MNNASGTLDTNPWHLVDGDLLIVKDKSEVERELTKDEVDAIEKEQAKTKRCVLHFFFFLWEGMNGGCF